MIPKKGYRIYPHFYN